MRPRGQTVIVGPFKARQHGRMELSTTKFGSKSKVPVDRGFLPGVKICAYQKAIGVRLSFFTKRISLNREYFCKCFFNSREYVAAELYPRDSGVVRYLRGPTRADDSRRNAWFQWTRGFDSQPKVGPIRIKLLQRKYPDGGSSFG